MWFVLALLSAVFAALTAILAKIGVDSVNGTLATAIRTGVVLVMVFLTHAERGVLTIDRKSWFFLILSGVATGASWLCYYHALKLGRVNQVAPIDKLSVVFTLVFAAMFLHEGLTLKTGLACTLIVSGVLLIAL